MWAAMMLTAASTLFLQYVYIGLFCLTAKIAGFQGVQLFILNKVCAALPELKAHARSKALLSYF